MAWIPADWITAGIAAEGLARAGVPTPLAAAYLDRAGSRPVMVFAEPSGVREDPLEMERTAWTE